MRAIAPRVTLSVSGEEQKKLACAEGASFPFKRRRHPRLPCRLPVRVRVRAGDDYQQHEAIATDISEGGVCLSMEAGVLRGSRIALSIGLPTNTGRLTTHGRVTYTQQSASRATVGIAFEFESTGELDEVARAVESLRAQ